MVDSDRKLAAFTYGYNLTLIAQRAGDLTALAQALRSYGADATGVELLAGPGTAPFAAAALAMAPEAFDAAAIDVDGFQFAHLETWKDADFFPGAVKYGDLAGLLSLYAPRPLAVAGISGENMSVANAAYEATGARERLTRSRGASPDAAALLLDWLLKE